MNNIEEIYTKEFLWSLPINYKGVILYPVLCENLTEFYQSVYSLLYQPIRYNAQISTLPRLYFLTDILNHADDTEYGMKNPLLMQLFLQLQFILKLVLKEQEVSFVCNNDLWFLQVKTANEKPVDIKSKDFEKIREIILHQNGVEYNDTFLHEDIRKWIEEQESKNKDIPATLEDYIEAFMLDLKENDMQKIMKISLRRFNRVLTKIFTRESYTIQTTASMSGFVTFKEKIHHWLTTDNEDRLYKKYFKDVK